ncbi:MAG TPA: lamin tail domain-containing protein, partial [Elusimicrobiota bacterium]|nr:lamin tail domain-containing protein [Elusimicrobiota bacterium]
SVVGSLADGGFGATKGIGRALARMLPPGAQIDLVTHSRGGIVGDLMTLDWSDAADAVSGVNHYEVQLSTFETFDLLEYSSVTPASDLPVTGLSNGLHYWRVKAADAAGNATSFASTRSFVVDASTPMVVDLQSGDDTWYLSDPGAAFNVDFEDIGSGLTTAQYTVDESPGLAGGEGDIVPWTDIFTATGIASYAADWSLDFNALPEGPHYVSVRAFDRVHFSTVATDVFYIRKDTSAPSFVDLQSGDTTWRSLSGTAYNVDFQDPGSGLSFIQYSVRLSTEGAGTLVKDWTDIAAPPVNQTTYATDWPVDFVSLQETVTNYVSVRAVDNLGHSTTVYDAFFVLKDVTPPTLSDNQLDDVAWHRADPGADYDVDFNDAGGSLLSHVDYTVAGAAGLAGGEGDILPWTNIALNVNTTYYDALWGVDFAALPEGQHYISARAVDFAGNVQVLPDAFFVRKDTTPPSVTVGGGLSGGDTTLRSVNDGTYDVDFADAGGSLLSSFEIKASTMAGGTGPDLVGYTTVLSGISSDTYTTNWSLPSAVFNALLAGDVTNYITVRVFDLAGSSTTQTDAFFVKKDTAAPSFVNNMAGGDALWRRADPGAVYNVDFQIGGIARLDRVQYAAASGPGLPLGDGDLIGWTDIAGPNLDQSSYAADWSVDFAALKSSFNWISVRAISNSASVSTLADAFIIRKDTESPAVTDLQSGDLVYRNAAGTVYNVDFADALSLLTTAQYTVASSSDLPGGTGNVVPWTDIFTSAGVASYTTDWAVNFSSLHENATNYVSVRVYDVAGSSALMKDAFFVLKDTTPPTYTDNQTGDDTWRRANTGLYAVEFHDTGGGRLSYFQTKITTSPSQSSQLVDDWRTVQSGLATNDLTAAWALAETSFGLLPAGTSYVHVRVYDAAGNVCVPVLVNAFSVRKDTQAPTFVNGEAEGDNTWRADAKTGGYNVDASDVLSAVHTYQFAVSSSPALPGGDGNVIPWTTIAGPALNQPLYSTDWAVNFTALRETVTNYVSVRAWDMAGTTGTLVDAFRILKDTTPPAVTNHMPAGSDAVWRTANPGAVYNVDFVDTGGSRLSKFQIKVTSGPSQTGTVAADWTDVSSGLAADDFSAEWSLPEAVWSALLQGPTNHVSVRAFDVAGNTSTVSTDAFKVFRDTTTPQITDNQGGDNTWYASDPGAIYDVDFADQESLLTTAEYRLSTSAAQGNPVTSWLAIFTSTGRTLYTDPWGPDFSAAVDGQNWVSVRAQDKAGNPVSQDDVFYLRKDSLSPTVTNNESGGDLTWRKEARAGGYNVDFYDTGAGVAVASYTVYDQTGRTGAQIIPWTTLVDLSGSPQSSYTVDWAVDFALLASGTGYVSVRLADSLGHGTTVNDVFFVRKDTTPPNALNTVAAAEGSSAGEIVLTWTAPGDDGATGQAASYVVKSKTAQFADQNDFTAANTYSQSWTPVAQGAGENKTVTGFTEGTTYYFAVEAVDKAGNQAALSNLTGNSAPARRVAPAAIGDLAAVTGDYPGEVTLGWTAVGDDNTSGTAAGYLVKYATYTITAGNFDSVSTYSQSIPPKAAGQTENLLVGGLTAGTTYYFAVKAYDDAQPWANDGGLSNVVSTRAAPSGPAAGMIAYGEGTQAAPRFDEWTGSAWQGSERTAQTAQATLTWSTLKSAAVHRNRKILGTLSSAGNLYVQTWNGDTDTWTSLFNTSNASMSSGYKGYDIAFEQNSGRALIAYYNGTPGRVAYRVWSSTADALVDGPTDFVLGTYSGAVSWVRLVPRPGTNDILLVTKDVNNDVYAARWNGSSFVNGREVTTSGVSAAYPAFDGAWETQSGRALVLYGLGTNLSYDIFSTTQGAWVATGAAGPAIAAGTAVQWVRLASDPISNRIGMTCIDNGSDWNAGVWSGSAWGALPAEDASADSNATRITDLAWEKDTGKLVVAAVDSATPAQAFDYITWQNNTWSANPGSAVADTFNLGNGSDLLWLELIPDPNTNKTILKGISANRTVATRNWTGSGWTDGTHHETNASTTTRECASLALDMHDTVIPSFVSETPVNADWQKDNSRLYNVDVVDAGGSKLTQIESKIATGAGQTGTVVQDWTTQVSGINADSYVTDWPLTSGTFNLIPENQTVYVSLRVSDAAGNQKTANDLITLKKDASAPSITDNQSGDDTWRNADPGNIYNVDFNDTGGSNFPATPSGAQYAVASAPGFPGGAGDIISWTNIPAVIGQSFTSDWGLNFSLLSPGTNYVSVRAYDTAGSTTVLPDVFYVKKDTVPPAAVADLAAVPGNVKGQIVLSWTAPGDNGSSGNNGNGSYLVKYSSQGSINDGNFSAAAPWPQTWVPVAAGQQESHVITGLTAGTTYYFALKTYDKVPNVALISNSPSGRPGTDEILINEIYASGGAGQDWVEFYNASSNSKLLDGWTLVYNNGHLSAPGTDSVVWTGTGADSISSGAIRKIALSADIAGTAPHYVVFKDSVPSTVDVVQWPALPAGTALARIYDGHPRWEIDPTPTSDARNAISTGPVKINEADYTALTQEFIELYNTSGSTVSLTDCVLRSKANVRFVFDRVVMPNGFSAVLYPSVDKLGTSYTDAFGAAGLDSAADFLVLENAAGQVLDRVGWQTASNYVHYDSQAQPASLPDAAAGGIVSPNVLGRKPSEGYDTDLDAADFGTLASPSLGGRNNTDSLAAANALDYPGDATVLPRRFKVALTLGENSAGGEVDTVWFVRTGGATDNDSPHIYRLDALGYDRSSTVLQSATFTGTQFTDLDGHPLVNGAVYKMILNSDVASGRAPQLLRAGLTYDASVHAVAGSTLSVVSTVNNGTLEPLLKITLLNTGSSGGNSLELERLNVRFKDNGGTDLTTPNAAALFSSLRLVRDSTVGQTGLYEAAFDTATLVDLPDTSFNLVGGGQSLEVTDPNSAQALVAAGETATFFLVAELADDASLQSPNTFRALTDLDADASFRESVSDVPQTPAAVDAMTTPVFTAVAPPAKM